MAWVKTEYGYHDSNDPGHQIYDFGGGQFYDPTQSRMYTQAEIDGAATVPTEDPNAISGDVSDWYNASGRGDFATEASRYASLDATNQLGEYETLYGEFPDDSAAIEEWFRKAIEGGNRTRTEQDRISSDSQIGDSEVMMALLAGGGVLVGSGAGLLSGTEGAASASTSSGGGMDWWDLLTNVSDEAGGGLDEVLWSGSDFTPTQFDAVGGSSAGGAFDMGGSQGVFDSFGNPLYTSPAGVGAGTAKTAFDSLKQILDNGGSVDDWLRLGGAALPGALQAFGNYQSGQSLKDLASQQKGQFDEFKAMGAPYRGRLADLYADPSKFLTSPEVTTSVDQGTNALARALSAKVGNPIENPTALSELQNYSANQLFGRLGQEKERLAGFGGLTAFNQSAAGAPGMTQLAQLGIGADAGIWGGLGRAAGDVFNPAPTTLADLLKQMQGSNIFKTVT